MIQWEINYILDENKINATAVTVSCNCGRFEC